MAKKHTIFHFKQFDVDHSGSTMKVGTDGVLLGAWAHIGNSKTILDIGTGSGVIALMMAQRSNEDTRIDAVEIDSHEAMLARKNVENSPWPQKITIWPSAIQNFAPEIHYDLIVSNPPFFSNSLEPPQQRRTESRHTISLPFRDLLSSVKRLLGSNGRFNVILPYTEGSHFLSIALQDLYLRRKWTFRSRAHKPAERLLLELASQDGAVDEGEVILYNEGEYWSEAYCDLTRDFYLRL